MPTHQRSDFSLRRMPRRTSALPPFTFDAGQQFAYDFRAWNQFRRRRAPTWATEIAARPTAAAARKSPRVDPLGTAGPPDTMNPAEAASSISIKAAVDRAR